jgi:hypothetical protein
LQESVHVVGFPTVRIKLEPCMDSVVVSWALIKPINLLIL